MVFYLQNFIGYFCLHTAHLQDDAGDTLQLPHPYTGAPIKLLVTNLTRTMNLPGSGGSGEYTDSIEGWVL